MTSRLTVLPDFGVTGDHITSVSSEPAQAARAGTEVAGQAPAPNVIDLHRHTPTPTGWLMQMLDGVTTALIGEPRAKSDGAVGAMDDRG